MVELAYPVKAKWQSGEVLNEPRYVKRTNAHKSKKNTKRPKKKGLRFPVRTAREDASSELAKLPRTKN